ncbi:LPXTG cell wall anchor domain-containing protein [Latilactobacillus sakei]
MQTETKQQARLPQTGTSSVGLSTIVGIVLLIGSLGLFKQRRGNF